MKKKYVSGHNNRTQVGFAGGMFNPANLLIAYYMILFAAVADIIIKGKLGFTRSTRDSIFLANARGIYAALLLNAGGYYSPAFPNMALLLTQIGDFNDAITNVHLKIMGSSGAKRAAKKALYGTLLLALDWINNLSRLDQINAIEIITGAGMHINGSPAARKQDFEVKQGLSTGEVFLACLAVKIDDKYVRASYDWQYSIDNGANWVNLTSTQAAKTYVTGMALVSTKFRKRTNSKRGGVSAWCTPVTFTVQ